MNILYIHTHDTGRYVQPYGYNVPTPNIQAFAEQSVLFRNAHCAGPTCSPSRAAMLTGMAPHSAGMIGLVHRGARILEPTRHLAAYLGRQGYETALIGELHEGDPMIMGYQHVLGHSKGTWEESAKEKAEQLRGLLSAKRDKPFFISCGFRLTHRQGSQGFFQESGPRGDGRYVCPPVTLPDTPETRQDFADFREAAAAYDRTFGELIRVLEESGHAEDTLVLLTTDHGIPFPRMKCTLTAHGTGVLLIMRGPKGFSGGKVLDALVSHLDVFPTLCDAADLPKPDWLQGVSLLPLVNGEAEAVREEAHTEVTYHAAYEPMRCVRTTEYAYIRRYDPKSFPVLPNCDNSLSKTLMISRGFAKAGSMPEELYDLTLDPAEMCNRANDPDYADQLADMRARLDRWMRETDDPLLVEGRVEEIAANMGITVNPQDKGLDEALALHP